MRIPQFQNNILVVNGVIIVVWLQLCSQVAAVSNPLWILETKNTFCYNPNLGCGPANWPETCHTGRHQSPIDIQAPKVSIYKRWTHFTFNQPYTSSQSTFYARNTGHSFQAQFEEGVTPSSSLTVGGAMLSEDYRFGQLHFHWGSEHTVNGLRYPLELHIVHYNTIKYHSLMDAISAENDPTALAVFAIFFQVGEENPALEPLVRAATRSMEVQDEYTHYSTPINVEHLLPEKLSFVRYSGSLTTPPCTENVVWTVFRHPVTISSRQIKTFQRVRNDDGELYTNYRPTQPVNGRRVETYGVPGLRQLAFVTHNKGGIAIWWDRLVDILSSLLQFTQRQLSSQVAFWRQALENALHMFSSSSISLPFTDLHLLF
ncbi:carbonic anhydrase 1 [Folsomia candida]|uniref:Carbonic anhydrase n=1 Tax=Folsomia candida TaxID=158441 RepID=A0A226F6E5_FOLCA|nr:carbonic anhydrase 1 [Folsomia candida]OXA65067.1 Carbonic anhydrase 2 [Folsomia candida]